MMLPDAMKGNADDKLHGLYEPSHTGNWSTRTRQLRIELCSGFDIVTTGFTVEETLPTLMQSPVKEGALTWK